jgi:hypothetical protein
MSDLDRPPLILRHTKSKKARGSSAVYPQPGRGFGAAFVHTRGTFADNLTSVGPMTSTNTKTSWTAGGGVATKLSHAWSVRTEHLSVPPCV